MIWALLIARLAFADGALMDEDPCYNHYLGSDGKAQNFKKAFECYSAQPSDPPDENKPLFLALMTFNGEGVHADRKKAEADLAKAQLASPESDVFAKAMVFARFNPDDPRAKEKLDFCRDIAQGTHFKTICGGMALKVVAKALDVEFARIASPKLKLAFEAFRDADTQVIYESYRFGTGRDPASVEHRLMLTESAGKMIRRAEGKDSTATKSADELKAADSRLNAAYKQAKANAPTAETLVKAQRLWLKYRDAVVEYARKSSAASDTALLTLLTEERVGILEALPKP